MKNRRIIVFALVFVSITPMLAYSQQCDFSRRQASTPERDFIMHPDGTVTHLESGLTWQRCVLGQTWHGGRCIGPARRWSLPDAKSAIERIQIKIQPGVATASTWRLPTLTELAFLVERQCVSPSINLALFPNLPTTGFWSGSQRKHGGAAFYILDFGGEGVKTALPQQKLSVRLVKGR